MPTVRRHSLLNVICVVLLTRNSISVTFHLIIHQADACNKSEYLHMAVADPGFEVRGRTFLGFQIGPLRGFPEATIKVYTWIFFEFFV